MSGGHFCPITKKLEIACPVGDAPLYLRVWHGIIDHFLTRASEWVMTSAILWTCLAMLNFPGSAFRLSATHYMTPVAPVWVWCTLGICAAVARLCALTINGTFHQFKYAPHLRMLGAAFGCFIWLQIALSLFTASMPTPGAAVLVSHMVALDLFSVFYAAGDIQKGDNDGRRI